MPFLLQYAHGSWLKQERDEVHGMFLSLFDVISKTMKEHTLMSSVNTFCFFLPFYTFKAKKKKLIWCSMVKKSLLQVGVLFKFASIKKTIYALIECYESLFFYTTFFLKYILLNFLYMKCEYMWQIKLKWNLNNMIYFLKKINITLMMVIFITIISDYHHLT